MVYKWGLGKKMKKIRERAEISVSDLSNRSGLSRQTIYNVEENDRIPRADVLFKWCGALGIDMVALLEGASVKAAPPPPEPEGPATLRDLKKVLERLEGFDADGADLVVAVVKTRLAQNRR